MHNAECKMRSANASVWSACKPGFCIVHSAFCITEFLAQIPGGVNRPSTAVHPPSAKRTVPVT